MNIKMAAISAACTFAFSTAAVAQQPAAAPPAWQQGKSDKFKDSKLAPNPGRNTETPAGEIAMDKLKVPQGFKIELWATGIPGGRAMVRGDKGKI